MRFLYRLQVHIALAARRGTINIRLSASAGGYTCGKVNALALGGGTTTRSAWLHERVIFLVDDFGFGSDPIRRLPGERDVSAENGGK